VRVDSALPERLTAVVDAVLSVAGVEHVAHGDRNAVRAAEKAVEHGAAALIGPYQSRAVCEAAEVTTPAGVPILAPSATWVGVTRDDEPGAEDDPASNDGTIFRLVARDMVVAQRIAAHVKTARVIAGDHEYGDQLSRQLERAGLQRDDDAEAIVLCGLVNHPEVDLVRELDPDRVIAFDGIQGSGLDVRIAMPFAPVAGLAAQDVFDGIANAERAAQLIVETQGLEGLRNHPAFDDHGDPVDPPVWLWRGLEPDRELAS
jgi:hypothetical protein